MRANPNSIGWVHPLWVSLLLITCIATVSPAETWHLKNGRRVEGKLEERLDHVFVVRDTEGRRVVIASSQLAPRLSDLEWDPRVQPLLQILQDRHRRLNYLLESGRISKGRYDREIKQQIDVCFHRIQGLHPERSKQQILSDIQSELPMVTIGQ